MDVSLIKENRKALAEPPRHVMSHRRLFYWLIKCQKLANNAGYPITKKDIMLQVQTSLGATGMVSVEYKAYRKKPVADKTQENANKHFHYAINNVEGIQKLTTVGSRLLANNINAKNVKDKYATRLRSN